MLSYRQYPALTLVTLIAFVALLALGTWQLKRMAWKNTVMSQLSEGVKKPPVYLPKNIDLGADELKKVNVIGSYIHDKEIHLAAKYRNGKPGFYILTPLKSLDGRIVLINRGWVPEFMVDSKTRPESLVSGNVSVVGLILGGFPQYWFSPKNVPDKNVWLSTDYAELKKSLNLDIENYIVQEIPVNGVSKLPIAVDPQIRVRNDHLHYALTWYALAFALAVMYFIYIRQQEKKNAGISNP